MKMKLPPKRDKAEVTKARKTLEEDDMYRYNLHVSRSLMARYLHLCKMKNKDGAKELTAYIKRQLAANDM